MIFVRFFRACGRYLRNYVLFRDSIWQEKREAAYLFDMMMKTLKTEIAQRIRED